MNVPPYLLDSNESAKVVWDYWKVVMTTDKVMGAEGIPVWEDLDDEIKKRFVEAFSIKIVSSMYNVGEQPKEMVSVPCYVCARNPVSAPGGICWPCWKIVKG